MGGLLAGMRVLEVALLAPDALGMHLADLGADVIKVEPPPGGDYVRDVGATMVEGVSALHRRWNRGKRSLALDLRHEQGARVFLDLVRASEAVVEGLRPSALARRGLGFEELRGANPSVVMVSLSGFGQTGPYRDLASHGVAYDAYAGLAPPTAGPEGHPAIPDHTPVGTVAGPLYGALALTAAVLRARSTGEGSWIDLSEADAAVAWNAAEIECHEVRAAAGRPSSGGAGLANSVRYQYYLTADGKHVLLMASERKFWERFCEAVGQRDLATRFPSAEVGDHAAGNVVLRRELASIFATRTQSEWVALFVEADVPGAPVNKPADLLDDPHFDSRARWLDAGAHRMPMLATPVRAGGLDCDPRPAPRAGEDTGEVLRDVLGYDDARVAALAASGCVSLGTPG